MFHLLICNKPGYEVFARNLDPELSDRGYLGENVCSKLFFFFFRVASFARFLLDTFFKENI